VTTATSRTATAAARPATSPAPPRCSPARRARAARKTAWGTLARFSGPSTLAVDQHNLWVADEGKKAVRKIDIATATVTTIAGDGSAGYLDSLTGLTAQFGSIESIATDGSTLWVADAVNHRIRSVSLTPPHASSHTVAGSGAQGHQDGVANNAELDGIRGHHLPGRPRLLPRPHGGDAEALRPATGAVLTLAGMPYVSGHVDGQGSAARFVSPRYMTSDGSGMLYISDTNGNSIRSYNTVTGVVGTLLGDGTCGYVDGQGFVDGLDGGARVHRPRGIAADGSNVYFAESTPTTVRQAVVATSAVSTLLGAPDPCVVDCSCGTPPPTGYAEGVGAATQWNGPWSVVYHPPSASLFVMDGGNYVIRRVQ
jgi:hypothetical protein